MPSYKFVDKPEELYRSALEFNKESVYLRELVGNVPKYFISFVNDGKVLFGLSKFCAFKDISVEAYMREFRYATDGGKTQKHISKTTGQEWVKYNKASKSLQSQFSQWIKSFYTNYNVNTASFITLSVPNRSEIFQSKVTPDELEEILEHKKIIGLIGEKIALAYEIERLKNLGCKDSHNYVVHTALLNISAGYDIFSDFDRQTRMIEVKTTVNGLGNIYLTRNELENFEYNPGKAYLYIVHITDMENKTGKVVREINNIDDLGSLEPVLYKVIR